MRKLNPTGMQKKLPNGFKDKGSGEQIRKLHVSILENQF